MPGSASNQQSFTRTVQRQQSYGSFPQQGQSNQSASEPSQTPLRPAGNRNLTINTQATPRVPVNANGAGLPVAPLSGYNPMGYPYSPAFPSPYLPPGPAYYGAPGPAQEPQSPWTYYSQYWQPSPAQAAQMDPLALYNAYMLPHMIASQQAAMVDPNTPGFARAVGAPAAATAALVPVATAPVVAVGTTGPGPASTTTAVQTASAEEGAEEDGGKTPTRANPGASDEPTPRKA